MTTPTVAVAKAPDAKPLRAVDRELERFQRDTAYHQMTILRDDGLYRHLRFMHVDSYTIAGRVPRRSSSYWFELITWPGSLAINGDCGTFTFSREPDMFGFFRSSGSRINPMYWAEKIRAQDKHKGVSAYSQDEFRQQVLAEVAPDENGDGPEKDWPGLTAAIQREILNDDGEWNTEYEEGAREALEDFRYPGHVTPGEPYFSFADAWEWDLSDWDWQYLWCCHAIQWGIARYADERKRLMAEGC